ncbi:MAG: M23 family metallopeptidase [Gammaproteobacteria bacterium]|nr:M23 family metallopeptidase [Gammaproteobacteria bacterium]
MNVIIFTKSRGSSRQIDLKRPRTFFTALAFVAAVAAVVFLTGYVYSARTIHIDPDVRVVELEQVIESRESELSEVRKTTRENIDALSARIGQLQANVVRLNALGARLSQMAKLDDGEFDFTSQPGLGGPQLQGGRTSLGVNDLNGELSGLENLLVNRQQQLGVLEDMLMTNNLYEQVHPEGWPLSSGWVSSYFGLRTDPFTGKRARHEGLDFAGREGTPIMAVAAGVVTWSSPRFGYGNLVEINHGGGYVTRYAHNKENSVAVGDRVEKGQVIAAMGSTGRATGANLHFEVMHNGRPVDPLDFIGERH